MKYDVNKFIIKNFIKNKNLDNLSRYINPFNIIKQLYI